MKKQNENNKLAFNKAVVTELNGGQLQEVKGGSILPITSITPIIPVPNSPPGGEPSRTRPSYIQ